MFASEGCFAPWTGTFMTIKKSAIIELISILSMPASRPMVRQQPNAMRGA